MASRKEEQPGASRGIQGISVRQKPVVKTAIISQVISEPFGFCAKMHRFQYSAAARRDPGPSNTFTVSHVVPYPGRSDDLETSE